MNLVAIDISTGLPESLIEKIDRTLQKKDLHIVLFNTEIALSFEVKSSNSFSLREHLRKISASAGCDPQCVIDFARKNKYKEVLIFSDGPYPTFETQGILVNTVTP